MTEIEKPKDFRYEESYEGVDLALSKESYLIDVVSLSVNDGIDGQSIRLTLPQAVALNTRLTEMINYMQKKEHSTCGKDVGGKNE